MFGFYVTRSVTSVYLGKVLVPAVPIFNRYYLTQVVLTREGYCFDNRIKYATRYIRCA